MILQLNPTIPLTTPLGRALCHFLIDNGDEHHLHGCASKTTLARYGSGLTRRCAGATTRQWGGK